MRQILSAVFLAGITSALQPDSERGVTLTPAFVSGQDGYHTYRIPSLLSLSNGDLLLFAEGRKFSKADNGWNDIVSKRSTDGGTTWGATEFIYGESSPSQNVTIHNPSPVALRSEPGRVLLVGCRNYIDVFQMWSDDQGVTWSKPAFITEEVTPRQANYSHVATGPPTGLQLDSGRLLITSDLVLQPSGDWVSASMYSDDVGKSWQLGNFVAGLGGNECQAAPAPNGSLVLNMRSREHKRQFSWSNDEGTSWSEPTALPFNNGAAYGGGDTEGSTVRLPGSDRLVFSTPFAAGRSNLSLFVSDDSGASWRLQRVVDPGSSAYSSLVGLNSTHVGLAYEKRDSSNTYISISYASIAVHDSAMSSLEDILIL